jgi:hypothetical protein
MSVRFPTMADLAARTRSGAAFTGVSTGAYGLITHSGTSLLGGPVGVSAQTTVPIIIGKRRYAIPVGTFGT